MKKTPIIEDRAYLYCNVLIDGCICLPAFDNAYGQVRSTV